MSFFVPQISFLKIAAKWSSHSGLLTVRGILWRGVGVVNRKRRAMGDEGELVEGAFDRAKQEQEQS